MFPTRPVFYVDFEPLPWRIQNVFFHSIQFSKLVVILDQLAINRYPIISIYPGEDGDGCQRIGGDGLA
jgi:hypothetical protein